MAGVGGRDAAELNKATRHQTLKRQILNPRGQKLVERMGLRAHAGKYGQVSSTKTGGIAARHRTRKLPVIVARHDGAQLPIKGR